MPTTLFLHAVPNGLTGTYPTNTQDPITPSFSAVGATVLRSMDHSLSPLTQSALTGTSLASTITQNGFMAYFCSPRLKGTQVVGGGNWTFNVADAQANLNANFAVNDASIYVWRPSTGTVVGYLKQAGSSGGALPATVAAQEQVSINTFSTTGITAQDGDVIIFEAWALFTQVMATAYTGTIYFDGPVRNTTENAAVTNHAAFITMSEDLNFYFTKHKKTIRIPVNFGAVADLTSNVQTALGSPIVYVPENSPTWPVNFSSVMLFLAAQDTSTVTGGSISLATGFVGLTGAGTTASVAMATATLANSGENWGGVFGPMDFTSHFNSFFGTVTNKAVNVQATFNISTGTGTTIRGVYGWLELTYNYDDTATGTRINTICYPLESSATTLGLTATPNTYSLANLTGSGGFLENHSNPVVRYRWLELRGNTNNNNTATNHNIGVRPGATGASVSLPVRVSALASDTWQMYQVDGSQMPGGATQTLSVWSTLASRWSNLVVNEWITYEYDLSGTTRLLNYVEIPMDLESPIPGTTAGVGVRYHKDLLISEPGTITRRAVAVELGYNTNASATIAVKGGSQSTYKSYAQSSNLACGMFGLQHRLDGAGSSSGNGIVLQRGNNVLTVDAYRTTGIVSNVSGVVKVLYSSDVSTQGADCHIKTCSGFVRNMTFTLTTDATLRDSFFIPEATYWLESGGYMYNLWMTGVGASYTLLKSQAYLLSSEGVGAGVIDLFADAALSDGELTYSSWSVRARPYLKKYPRDPDGSLLDITQDRPIRTFSSTNTAFGFKWNLAYRVINFEITGTISGSSGGSITLNCYKLDSLGEGTIVDSKVVTGNGDYSFTVYDDTIDYYVTAYESATSKGVSKEAVPGTGFDISMTATGGGEYFF